MEEEKKRINRLVNNELNHDYMNENHDRIGALNHSNSDNEDTTTVK